MGYGGYDHSAHQQITRRQADLPREQLFTETRVRTDMCVRNMKPRESRDSADHPESLAIAFLLDGTGSMDRIPEQMARDTLPQFMATVLGLGVRDPQILFGMVGDTFTDLTPGREPIQIGEFESTAELINTWLRRYARDAFHGGGNGGESYHLGFTFLAKRTVIDCLEKRGKRGYAIFTGDDHAFPSSGHTEIGDVFGDIHEGARPVRELLAEAQEKYHVFFIIPDPQRALSRGSRGTVEETWRTLLGDRVVVSPRPEDVCAISGALIALTEGTVTTLDDLFARLHGLGIDEGRVGGIMKAVTPYANAIGRGARPPAAEPDAGSRSTPRDRRQARDAAR